MTDELKTIKFQLMLSESEAQLIDDWGFANRIRSRAEAIRRLCQIGMVWDENRNDVMRGFGEVFESIRSAAEALKPNDRAFSDREHQVVSSLVDAMINVTETFRPLRTAHGVAANFGRDEEIEKIIAEADELKKRIQDLSKGG